MANAILNFHFDYRHPSLNRIWMQLCKLCFRLVWTLIFCVAIHNFLQKSIFLQIFASLCDALGSNNVSICASLGTHAYLSVQQKVCWHTSPMRTIKMLHTSMLTCIIHVCSRSYISHVGMLEHSILIAPMGQHTRGFQEQNYYVMYFIKFTWFQLQNKMFHISLHTWIRPHITGWCKSA